MTKDEILDSVCLAETYPGSLTLNFNEVAYSTLVAWVEMQRETGADATLDQCDIESVKRSFQFWWIGETQQ
jgi:hypothetical protein